MSWLCSQWLSVPRSVCMSYQGSVYHECQSWGSTSVQTLLHSHLLEKAFALQKAEPGLCHCLSNGTLKRAVSSWKGHKRFSLLCAVRSSLWCIAVWTLHPVFPAQLSSGAVRPGRRKINKAICLHALQIHHILFIAYISSHSINKTSLRLQSGKLSSCWCKMTRAEWWCFIPCTDEVWNLYLHAAKLFAQGLTHFGAWEIWW